MEKSKKLTQFWTNVKRQKPWELRNIPTLSSVFALVDGFSGVKMCGSWLVSTQGVFPIGGKEGNEESGSPSLRVPCNVEMGGVGLEGLGVDDCDREVARVVDFSSPFIATLISACETPSITKDASFLHLSSSW